MAALVAREPKAVADMTPQERQEALLTHLCYMVRRRAYGGKGFGSAALQHCRDNTPALHAWVRP